MLLFESTLRTTLTGYLLIVTLFSTGCSKQTYGKWSLVRYENSAHAAGLHPIMFAENGTGWALNALELYRVQDQGKTWVPVLRSQGGQRGFYSFTFLNLTLGFIVGTQNLGPKHSVLVLRTTDGGSSWEERPTDVLPEGDRDKSQLLRSVTFCGERDGWAVGGDLILHTSDGGVSWTTQHANTNGQELSSVACSNENRAWVTGTGGTLLMTRDGGNSWTRQETRTTDTLFQVRFFGEKGWIVGGAPGKASLIHSDNGGESWEIDHKIKSTSRLFDVFFVGSRGWIAGEKGAILQTNDGGRTWIPQETPTKEDLTSLFFTSPTEGWAAGDRMTLLHFSP